MRTPILAALVAVMPLWQVQAEDKKVEGVVTAMMAIADRIDLLPGQSIVFTPDRGKMSMILFVEGDWEIDDGQIKLEFASDGGQSKLVVTSKADVPFRYRAEMLKQAGAKKGKSTSTCTLLPGIEAFETWPHAIAALRVTDFAAAPDGAISCR